VHAAYFRITCFGQHNARHRTCRDMSLHSSFVKLHRTLPAPLRSFWHDRFSLLVYSVSLIRASTLTLLTCSTSSLAWCTMEPSFDHIEIFGYAWPCVRARRQFRVLERLLVTSVQQAVGICVLDGSIASNCTCQGPCMS
jgi:hypothetical protein